MEFLGGHHKRYKRAECFPFAEFRDLSRPGLSASSVGRRIIWVSVEARISEVAWVRAKDLETW